MPLSSETRSLISQEREQAWRITIGWLLPSPRIWSPPEDWQWFMRDREQDKRNQERKIQWATKLRFIRPDAPIQTLA